jgi:hypothetical protein
MRGPLEANCICSEVIRLGRSLGPSHRMRPRPHDLKGENARPLIFRVASLRINALSLRQLEGVKLFRRRSEVAELVRGHSHGRKCERGKGAASTFR